MYKAICQMMKRGQGKMKQTMTPPTSGSDSSDELCRLRAENEMLKQRINDVAKVLGRGHI